MEPLVAFQGLKGDPIANDTTYLGHMTNMTEARSDIKVFLLQSSFHGTRKYYANCQEREAIKHPYPAAHES